MLHAGMADLVFLYILSILSHFYRFWILDLWIRVVAFYSSPMQFGSVITLGWRSAHSHGASTSLRLNSGWTPGSGHGPQWGTWATTSGGTNENTSRTEIFIVETSFCHLQKNKIDSHPLNEAFVFRGKKGRKDNDGNFKWRSKVDDSSVFFLKKMTRGVLFLHTNWNSPATVKNVKNKSTSIPLNGAGSVRCSLPLTNPGFELETGWLVARFCSSASLCHQRVPLCAAAWFLTWSKLLAKWSHGGHASRNVTNESQRSSALPNQD